MSAGWDQWKTHQAELVIICQSETGVSTLFSPSWCLHFINYELEAFFRKVACYRTENSTYTFRESHLIILFTDQARHRSTSVIPALGRNQFRIMAI